jgi:hypothetical protein
MRNRTCALITSKNTNSKRLWLFQRLPEVVFNPTTCQLRQFLGVLVFLCGVIAVGLFRKGKYELGSLMVGLMTVLTIVAILRPQLGRGFYTGVAILAWPIGWLISQIILAVVFFGVVTPIALIMRLRGRDALRLQSPRDSNWRVRDTEPELEQYFRQF